MQFEMKDMGLVALLELPLVADVLYLEFMEDFF